MKVGPFHDSSSLKRPDDNVTKELLSSHLQQTIRHRQHYDFVSPGLMQQAFTIFNRCQNRRSKLRTQNCDGMRIERNRDRWSGNLTSQRPQLLQHRRMATMNAVKVADCNAAFACTLRDMKIKNGHGSKTIPISQAAEHSTHCVPRI